MGWRGRSDWRRGQHKVSVPEEKEEGILWDGGRQRWKRGHHWGVDQMRQFTDDSRGQISHCWRRELQILKRKNQNEPFVVGLKWKVLMLAVLSKRIDLHIWLSRWR